MVGKINAATLYKMLGENPRVYHRHCDSDCDNYDFGRIFKWKKADNNDNKIV